MKRILAVFLAVLFVALFTPAFSAAADKMPSADKTFAQKAVPDGMFEVEAGKVAAQKGTSEDVKAFGQRMVDDHTKVNNELMQIVESKGLKLPKKLDSKGKAQLSKLSKLSGADFDKEYMTLMVKAHQGAVKLFSNEADKGKDPELKAFAAKTLPILQDHLKMAQETAAKVGAK